MTKIKLNKKNMGESNLEIIENKMKKNKILDVENTKIEKQDQNERNFEENGYLQQIIESFSGNENLELKINDEKTLNIDISKKGKDGRSDIEKIISKVKILYKGEENYDLFKATKEVIENHGFNDISLENPDIQELNLKFKDFSILNKKLQKLAGETIKGNFEEKNNNQSLEKLNEEIMKETSEEDATPIKIEETTEESKDKLNESSEEGTIDLDEKVEKMKDEEIEKNIELEASEENINENFDKLKESKNINNPQAQIANKMLTGENLEKAKEFYKNSTKENPKNINEKNIKKIFSPKDNLSTSEEELQYKNFLKKIKDIPENKNSIPRKNMVNFTKDFKELADIAHNGTESKFYKNGELGGEKEVQKNGKYKIIACERIQENYIKVFDNPEANKNLAIETTGAEIINRIEGGIDDSNRIIYRNAVNKLHSDDGTQKFEGLSELIKLEQINKLDTAKKFIKTYPKAKAKDQKKGRENYFKIKGKISTDKDKKPIYKKLSKIIREGFEIFGNTNESFNKFLDKINVILQTIDDISTEQTSTQSEINENISEIINETNGTIKEN